MSARRELPMRRRSETFNVAFGGARQDHVVTVGFYNDSQVGEVFINSGRSGEQVEAIARDGAVLLSLALQFGVPLATIAGALTRDVRDEPGSLIGAVVDRLRG